MQIVTDHLILREFEEGDLDAIIAYQSDPRYLRYYEPSWGRRSPEQVRAFLLKQIKSQREQPRTAYQLAITLRENGTMIGNVGLRMPRSGATEADMGCELAPEYWNLGHATEAVRAIIAFGFEELGLHRIWASTIADNSPARHVLEKLGMTLEGELRETTLLADGWANSVIYGILEHEWRATGAARGQSASRSAHG